MIVRIQNGIIDIKVLSVPSEFHAKKKKMYKSVRIV